MKIFNLYRINEWQDNCQESKFESLTSSSIAKANENRIEQFVVVHFEAPMLRFYSQQQHACLKILATFLLPRDFLAYLSSATPVIMPLKINININNQILININKYDLGKLNATFRYFFCFILNLIVVYDVNGYKLFLEIIFLKNIWHPLSENGN